MERLPGTPLLHGDEEEEPTTTSEKIACNRCRQRKVKCDRDDPCSNCQKTGTACLYGALPKSRERRQRVMVSYTYDSKLDAISRKIDELHYDVSQLNHKASGNSSTRTARSCISPSSARESSFVTHQHANETLETRSGSSRARYEGESSLSAHAFFANRFLQNVLANTTCTEDATKLQSVLANLKNVIRSKERDSDELEKMYPCAKSIEPDSTTRSLPLPPTDKVFICLRMARECPQVAALWLGDFLRPNDFSEYFIRVASPGPASEATLIIVHCGLHWLFNECSKATTDQDAREDYNAEAEACKANLETVLLNLRYHQPTNFDSVYAMGLSSMYCLQVNRPSAAWGFISSASQMIQTIGLQHDAPEGVNSSEEQSKRRNLFWAIYMVEKTLSLRLGRSSTFQDHEITSSRPSTERSSGSFLGEMNPHWIQMASLQGRIYNDMYSPGALRLPSQSRISRGQALAADVKALIEHTHKVHEQYNLRKGQELGFHFHEIARRFDRVIGLSMLTLIYRGMEPQTPQVSVFSHECVVTARDAVREHNECVEAINNDPRKTILLETYINSAIIQFPFVPYIVLFCHVIETVDSSDLQHMRKLIETFDPLLCLNANQLWCRQYRLFKALYDVAATYVESKSSMGTTLGPSFGNKYWHQVDIFNPLPDTLGIRSASFGQHQRDMETPGIVLAPDDMPPRDEVMGLTFSQLGSEIESWTLHNAPFWDIDFG